MSLEFGLFQGLGKRSRSNWASPDACTEPGTGGVFQKP